MPKSLKFTLDRKSLETIYVSFIRPSLEYANTLWAGAYDKDLTKLDSLEVEAMRSVTGATAGSNIANLYKVGFRSLIDGTSTASVSCINCLEVRAPVTWGISYPQRSVREPTSDTP